MHQSRAKNSALFRLAPSHPDDPRAGRHVRSGGVKNTSSSYRPRVWVWWGGGRPWERDKCVYTARLRTHSCSSATPLFWGCGAAGPAVSSTGCYFETPPLKKKKRKKKRQTAPLPLNKTRPSEIPASLRHNWNASPRVTFTTFDSTMHLVQYFCRD